MMYCMTMRIWRVWLSLSTYLDFRSRHRPWTSLVGMGFEWCSSCSKPHSGDRRTIMLHCAINNEKLWNQFCTGMGDHRYRDSISNSFDIEPCFSLMLSTLIHQDLTCSMIPSMVREPIMRGIDSHSCSNISCKWALLWYILLVGDDFRWNYADQDLNERFYVCVFMVSNSRLTSSELSWAGTSYRLMSPSVKWAVFHTSATTIASSAGSPLLNAWYVCI